MTTDHPTTTRPENQETPLTSQLIWHDWVSAAAMPLFEPLLVTTDSLGVTFQVATFAPSLSGKILGFVGGYFHYDCKIFKWARLGAVIGKDNYDLRGHPSAPLLNAATS